MHKIIWCRAKSMCSWGNSFLFEFSGTVSHFFLDIDFRNKLFLLLGWQLMAVSTLCHVGTTPGYLQNTLTEYKLFPTCILAVPQFASGTVTVDIKLKGMQPNLFYVLFWDLVCLCSKCVIVVSNFSRFIQMQSNSCKIF